MDHEVMAVLFKAMAAVERQIDSGELSFFRLDGLEGVRVTWEQWWKTMPEDLRASYGPQAIVATKHAWDAAMEEAKNDCREDAQRWRFISQHFKCAQPDMGGNHRWMLSHVPGGLIGIDINKAVDVAMTRGG